MLTAVMLSALLMLGVGVGAAADLQVYGKSLHGDKTVLGSNEGRHSVRKQPRQQTKSEIHRSLDLESFNIQVTPPTSKLSLPTIIKLYPPTAKPLHMHANMPMRFGRQSDPGDDRSPNSTPNMPQRFGRSWELLRMCAECRETHDAANPVLPQRFGQSWELLRMCAECRETRDAANPVLPQRFGRSWELLRMCAECRDTREAANPVLPQRFGRSSPYWTLLRTLATEQLLNTDVNWDEEFTTSLEEEAEVQDYTALL